ncbi:hypothetical protein ACOSQ2_015208 [Xanthoceras sorbifolium]
MENRTRFGGGSGKDFDTNIKNINGNRFYKGSVDNSTKARVGSKSKNNTTNGGLRFEILKMDVEENVDKDKGSKVTVASSSKLLADISNDVWDRGKKLGSGSRKKSSKNKCSNFSNGEKSKESVEGLKNNLTARSAGDISMSNQHIEIEANATNVLR